MDRPDRGADEGTLPADLLAILVCPVDKGRLRQEPNVLVCTACGRRYPIEDGIPNMLVDDEPGEQAFSSR